MHSINKYTSRQREFTFIELKNDFIKATFMDYGATIISIFTNDFQGNSESILMAYESLGSYKKNKMYLNATIGPFSGRIKDSKFVLNGEEILLDSNFLETVNIHGGKESIAFKFFDYTIEETKEYSKLTFKYRKKAKTSKFPGNQLFTITYTLLEDSLLIEFRATTDQDTVVNLTNHAYYNLSGNLKSDIMDQELQVNSSKALKLDEKFCPESVYDSRGTHLDFREMKPIKDNFFDGIYDLPEKGIDNPMLLDQVDFNIPQVILKDNVSKRIMEVYTTYPCVVVYTHNHITKKELLFGAEHRRHMGICFETQFEPNGMNVKGLSNSILLKDEVYYEKTLLKFKIGEWWYDHVF